MRHWHLLTKNLTFLSLCRGRSQIQRIRNMERRLVAHQRPKPEPEVQQRDKREKILQRLSNEDALEVDN